MSDTTADAGVVGYQPIVRIDGPIPQPGNASAMPEDEKYRKMWDFPQYRQVAPGEDIAPLFLAQARPKPGAEVIDFGSGTGRGALMLAVMGGMKVRMLDFADNALDDDVRQMLTTQAHAMSFAVQDLNHPIPWTAEYGFCTDVMEHIPPQEVDGVLTNILKAGQHVFFQISCTDDVCGALIGQPLHLSVHPYAWWLAKFRDEFDCAIHWSQDLGTHCLFYVSAWWSGQKMTEIGVLNTEEQRVLANVEANVQLDVMQAIPHEPNDTEVMILGGGPSLAAHVADIKRLAAQGVKIITLNGAYNWAIDQGLQVGAQIVVDARDFNKRFVEPVQPNCKYFLASQCDPALYAAVPREAIYQWHTSWEALTETLNKHLDIWFSVPGGSTVLLRAIPLMRMMGFRSFHIFGCDSCLLEEKHHAFEQPENDGQMVIDVIVGGRTFKCHPWMVSQANEFMDLVKIFADEVQLEIYGNGLLAWILQHGYDVDVAAEAAQELQQNTA